VARVGAAQRIRFEDQRVTLTQNGAPVTQLWSDVLVGGSVKWTKSWSIDATAQYNPEIKESQRSTLAARYSPSNYRLATLAYQRERAASEMINVGWQWPVNDLWGDKGEALGSGLGQGGRRWYSVGRMNFNLVERRMVDALYGFEYDGCCWIGRAVLQRTYTSRTTSNTQIMFQIEFVGLSYLGNNPLGTLRTNIPQYQNLRNTQTTPSRFTNYD
jgi:LPS-assembly protein